MSEYSPIFTRVATPIRPWMQGSQAAIIRDKDLRGGYRVVNTITERNSIPEYNAVLEAGLPESNYRIEGMLCYVVENSITYRLVGGVTNDHWVNIEGLIPEHRHTKLYNPEAEEEDEPVLYVDNEDNVFINNYHVVTRIANPTDGYYAVWDDNNKILDFVQGYSHPTGGLNQPEVPLSGNTVISQILVNELGHVTGIDTRDLTLYTHSLNDHSDVGISNPQNGQVLRFNGNNWINETITIGGDNYYLSALDLNNSTGLLTATVTGTSNVTVDLSPLNTMRDPATVNPLAHGTASVGTSLKYAREDHVHPSDNTNTNYYLTGLDFNTGTGLLTATVTGSSNVTVNLDNRYSLIGHTHIYDNYEYWVLKVNNEATGINITSQSNVIFNTSSPLQIVRTTNILSFNHLTTAGNKHIPSGGSTNQVLVYGGSSGSAEWGAVPTHTHDYDFNWILKANNESTGTTISNGLDVLFNHTNPISISRFNRTITISHLSTAGNLHVPSGGSTNQVLTYGGSSGVASWGSVPTHSHDYDNYISWRLLVNSTLQTNITSDASLNFTGGGATSISYNSGTVTVSSSNTNYYLTALSFNTSTGLLTGTVNGASNPTVNLDGRYALLNHTHDFKWLLKAINEDDIGYSVGANDQVIFLSTDPITVSRNQYTVSYGHLTSAGYKHIPSGGSTNQYLKYAGSSGTAEWADLPELGISNHNLNYHDDVNISNPSNGQILIYSSGNWINSSLSVTISSDILQGGASSLNTYSTNQHNLRRFYTTNDTPTGTSRLNIGAYFYATRLYDGNQRVYSPNNQNLGTTAGTYAEGSHSHYWSFKVGSHTSSVLLGPDVDMVEFEEGSNITITKSVSPLGGAANLHTVNISVSGISSGPESQGSSVLNISDGSGGWTATNLGVEEYVNYSKLFHIGATSSESGVIFTNQNVDVFGYVLTISSNSPILETSSGGVFTPTDNKHITTKKYVDDKFSSINTYPSQGSDVLNKSTGSGSWSSTNLGILESGGVSSIYNTATFGYSTRIDFSSANINILSSTLLELKGVETSIVSNNPTLKSGSGGVFTPSNNNHIATKKYVDDNVSGLPSGSNDNILYYNNGWKVNPEITINQSGHLYFGDQGTNGSFRLVYYGGRFVIEKRIGGSFQAIFSVNETNALAADFKLS